MSSNKKVRVIIKKRKINKIIIPPKHQAQLLAELHEGHLGIVKMKALARSYLKKPLARLNL